MPSICSRSLLSSRTLFAALGLASASVSAQDWQKVYPPNAQTGRWAALTKVPGGAWYIAGDGMLLRSTDLTTFTPELTTPSINWRGVALQRIDQVSYTLLVTGGSSIAQSDINSPSGYTISTLGHGVTTAHEIACHASAINGPCVIAAENQILFGQLGALNLRLANISNHNVNFTNGRFFVTGYGGGVSAWDGVNWIDSAASFADVYDVAFGPDGNAGQHYVTAGDAGVISRSTALTEWSYTQPLELYYAKSVIYADGRYWAVGAFLPQGITSVAESIDGINWDSGQILPDAAPLYDLKYADGTYVAVGENREIWILRPDPLHADGFED